MIFRSKMWMKEITGVWKFSWKNIYVFTLRSNVMKHCALHKTNRILILSSFCCGEKCHRFDDFVVLCVSCQNCSCTSWRLHFELRIDRNIFWIAVSMTCSLRILLISLWSFEKKMWVVNHDNWSTALFFSITTLLFVTCLHIRSYLCLFSERQDHQSRNFCDDDYCQTRESSRVTHTKKNHDVWTQFLLRHRLVF